MPPRPAPQQGGGNAIPVAGDEGLLFQIQNYKGLNTKADRSGIDDDEFSWLENFFPLAKATLRTLPSNANALYTEATRTINCFFPFNIGSVQYIIVFYTNGTADVVKVAGGVVVVTGAANTFFNGGDLPFARQWAASGILIVTTASANGYYAWDDAGGGTLYAPGTPAPNWLTGTTPLTPTGTPANGNNVITAVSSTTGIVAGMLINGPNIPTNSIVQSTTVNTITMNNNATGSPGSVGLTVQWGMPTGIKGTAVEVFQSRAWVDNGATKFFSAPANGANFAGAQGGGAITATDSFLRIKFTISLQASSFLYSFGDSSINVISNVQSTGSPIVTTFNNQNVDPQVGTPWLGTVQAFGRGIVFANPAGVYALYGGAAEKVSDALDDVFANADFVSFTPTAGVATVYGVKVYCLLLRATDFAGTVRNMLFIWDGKKWFVGSQVNNLTYGDSQEINSVLSLWGTDGKVLFKCFQTPSTSLNKIIQTKLFEGTTYLIVKQLLRFFTLGKSKTSTPYALTGTVDIITDHGTATIPIAVTGQSAAIVWLNNTAGVVNWLNNLGQLVIFVTTSFQLQGQDAAASANLIGVTLQSTSADFILNAASLGYRRQAPTGG
jgi:hypothetical protein